MSIAQKIRSLEIPHERRAVYQRHTTIKSGNSRQSSSGYQLCQAFPIGRRLIFVFRKTSLDLVGGCPEGFGELGGECLCDLNRLGYPG